MFFSLWIVPAAYDDTVRSLSKSIFQPGTWPGLQWLAAATVASSGSTMRGCQMDRKATEKGSESIAER
jgi:hypothetical protein